MIKNNEMMTLQFNFLRCFRFFSLNLESFVVLVKSLAVIFFIIIQFTATKKADIKMQNVFLLTPEAFILHLAYNFEINVFIMR